MFLDVFGLCNSVWLCGFCLLYMFKCPLLTYHVRVNSSWPFSLDLLLDSIASAYTDLLVGSYVWVLKPASSDQISLTGGERIQTYPDHVWKNWGHNPLPLLIPSVEQGHFVFHFHPRGLSQVWPIPIQSMLMWRHFRNFQGKTFEPTGAVLYKRSNII